MTIDRSVHLEGNLPNDQGAIHFHSGVGMYSGDRWSANQVAAVAASVSGQLFAGGGLQLDERAVELF